jgi:hypothetical protein
VPTTPRLRCLPTDPAAAVPFSCPCVEPSELFALRLPAASPEISRPGGRGCKGKGSEKHAVVAALHRYAR